MSGFGGFGSTSNSQPNTGGFGSFGNSSNTTGGFGSTSSLFGSGNNANNTSGFGGTSSSFGGSGFGGNSTPNNANSANTGATTGFGSRPSLFGGGQNNTGSLFGSTTAGNTSSGFGGSFGAGGNSNTTNAGGFGNTGTSGSLFGGTGGGFGATTSTGFGQGSVNSTTNQNNGTASVPFSATQEKEGHQTSYFQSITFQPQYSKYSFEELRSADYQQGRRYPNQSFPGPNQSYSSGFNTGSTGFGGTSNTTSNTPFGGTNNSNTSGGLFGTTQSNPTPASTAFSGFGSNSGQPSGGGLFSNSNASQPTSFGGSSFGGGNTTSNTFSGFGTQPKPTGTLFGGPSAGGLGSGNSGFGANNTAPGASSGFGTGNSLFGTNSTNNNTNQPTGAFGGNNTGTNSLFGGNSSNPNEQKPNSLFGGQNGTTTGGLFGGSTTANNGSNTQQPGSGLFGNANTSNNASSGTNSLFGNLGKPATSTGTASTGLFGTNPSSTGSNSLFGGLSTSQPQSNAGNSLFGGASQQPKSTGLFGGLGSTTAGTASNNSGSIFGGLNNTSNQSGGSLFGGSQSQPNPSTSSIFSSSTQPNQFQTQAFTTSISDGNAFGNQPLFASLNSTPVQTPGPLATPLSTSQKQKHTAIYPPYRRNPFDIPRTPLSQGYGLSYSRYGTPSSAVSSVAGTPRNNGISLLGNSLRKPLGKSTSMINLGATYQESEGVFAPNAFSASSRRSGSMRRLMIDRNVRTDLFSPNDTPKAQPSNEVQEPAAKLNKSLIKKRVSFDASTAGKNSEINKNIFAQANGSMSMDSPTGSDNTMSNGVHEQNHNESQKSEKSGRSGSSKSDDKQVPSKELTIVPEEDSQATPTGNKRKADANGSSEDQGPGDYWMDPPIQELQQLSRDKLKKVKLTVGRDNCGEVSFNEPVDLTGITLEDIMGKIVEFKVRKCTVYPDNISKPSPGRGLNVPATIELQHSGPSVRNKKRADVQASGPALERHTIKLKRIPDTKFLSFNGKTGLWRFSVQHFTTYGIDDDESELPDEDMGGTWPDISSELSPPPSTPGAQSLTMRDSPAKEENTLDEETGAFDSDHSPEDTFGYKKSRTLPGAFSRDELEFISGPNEAASRGEYIEDRMIVDGSEDGSQEQSSMVLDDEMQETPREKREGVGAQRQHKSPSNHDTRGEVVHDLTGLDSRSSHSRANTMIQDQNLDGATHNPGRSLSRSVAFRHDEDWSVRLQHSVSPSKSSRQVLARKQNQLLEDLEQSDSGSPPKVDSHLERSGFATSIDIMHSLYGRSTNKPPKRQSLATTRPNGFQWSMVRAADLDRSVSSLPAEEWAFHNTFRPSWSGQEGILLVNQEADFSSNNRQIGNSKHETLQLSRRAPIAEDHSLCFGQMTAGDREAASTMIQQLECSLISHEDGIPAATVDPSKLALVNVGEHLPASNPRDEHEKSVWSMLNTLSNIETRSSAAMKEAISDHWASSVKERALQQAERAGSSEERAIAFLSAHMIEEACSALMEGGNFHLATMIARVGTDKMMMDDMKEQLDRFRSSKTLSEFSDPIRALYELLAGNVGLSKGQNGAPEDRVQAFTIPHRFEMDWKQAFGLHLWYGSSSLSALDEIIAAFEWCTRKVANYPQPRPWYDEAGACRENDILWGLIRLFGHISHHYHGRDDFDILEVISIATYSSNPLDARLAWQVYHYLEAKGILHPHATRGFSRQLDQLTLDVAAQLSWMETWPYSLLPLLYLSDAGMRQRAIATALEAQAHKIFTSQQDLTLITEQLKIPRSWVWRACATFCKSSNDPEQTAYCYVNCGDKKGAEQALEVITTSLGPQAVVYGDLTPLKRVLIRMREKGMGDEMGSERQMYSDYIQLVEFKERSGSQAGSQSTEVLKNITKRLARKLKEQNGMATGSASYEATMEQVALGEMSRMVGRVMLDYTDSSSMSTEVLGLPITGIGYTETAIDLGLQRYKELLVG